MASVLKVTSNLIGGLGGFNVGAAGLLNSHIVTAVSEQSKFYSSLVGVNFESLLSPDLAPVMHKSQLTGDEYL